MGDYYSYPQLLFFVDDQCLNFSNFFWFSLLSSIFVLLNSFGTSIKRPTSERRKLVVPTTAAIISRINPAGSKTRAVLCIKEPITTKNDAALSKIHVGDNRHYLFI
jgi:hypothetical protein